jgi:hypothetical protein
MAARDDSEFAVLAARIGELSQVCAPWFCKTGGSAAAWHQIA